ncbi:MULTISPECIES: phenylpyruvate tautomerase MIF-related protein [unclassified Prochlorococcus]|uniref:phenylpyruvate tautomerase MIF-related protein n=1 Tax=unclassified Prochlorococcus TaxID=2627481 RepID=UPI000561644A|nr:MULTISPECIES: phenylpyruvate tautomerase MIF-related protein [unclassified Prochlorococcus]
MPLINIQASVPAVADANSILQELSSKLANLLGKPERYVMTSLQCGVPMTFAGDLSSTCYVEVKSIGALDGSRTHEVSELVCSHMEQKLGIPADRTYIVFEDVPARLWGWNGSTFG